MCMSTAYKDAKNNDNLICKYVSNIAVKDEKVVLTDLMGAEIEVEGTLECVDLVDNYVIIKTA